MRKFFYFFLMTIIFAYFNPISYAAFAEEQNDTEVFFFKAKEVDVPIIMYHLVTENSKYIGKYGVSPTELEEDLKYLKKNGYNTIVMQDLIDFVEKGKKLPKNPILLSFDDGNSSDYRYLLPLLQQYKMKAVIAIIGEAVDRCTKDSEGNPTGKYPNLTWTQVAELHKSGIVEVQSHGYNVHGKRGSGKNHGEDAQAYHARLLADLTKLQQSCETHLGYVPNTFIYPLGIISDGSREVLEELGFVASLSCLEGVNKIRQGDKDCLFSLKRYNRPSGQSLESLLKTMKTS